MKLLFVILLSTVAGGARAWAAACCGGGFAAPALIAGDERAQVALTTSQASIHADVPSDGLWRERQDREEFRELRLEAAHLLSDRWQAGFSLPLVERERAGRKSSGLGDVNLNGGYEFLTDWDYHPWRPKGLIYGHVTAPTGKAVQESEDLYQLSARGRGFWAVGAGTLLSKMFGRWDTFVSADVRRSFARDYHNSQAAGRVHPGWGATWGAGAGYNYGDWRAGAALLWSYEDPLALTGDTVSRGAAQRYATAALSITRLLPHEFSASLSYSDQTWFGSPSNTSLSRGVILLLQKRWLR